jgi:hypothetical protein
MVSSLSYLLYNILKDVLQARSSPCTNRPNPTEPFVGGTVMATPTGIDAVRPNAVAHQQVPIAATQATPILMLRIKLILWPGRLCEYKWQDHVYRTLPHSYY